MRNNLHIYNTLTRSKEKFNPIKPPYVGLYVCGPTVYDKPHLGHARMAITFDVLYRYLQHLNYKVRYVRNITDVGHIENETTGEDKIIKKAKIEDLEPMEIVQKYKNIFQESFTILNLKPPNIEPHASGHIIEQQQMIKKIIKNGFAYESNGSVYFDINKYNQKYKYGKLSGRKIEDMVENSRELQGTKEKNNPIDFALWKKAKPEHIMNWNSDWSDGFPGWHIECSAMGTKYLGETFDIHGGGLDLMFPHHECEIAQSKAANGKSHVNYWMHNNMITIDGQKMSKSLNNFITLDQIFSGNHGKLEKSYSPMTVKFFILQTHYRNIINFSNKALQASEKSLERIFNAMESIPQLNVSKESSIDIEDIYEKCLNALNDDLNISMVISHIFEIVKYINLIKQGKKSIDIKNKNILKKLFDEIVINIMGLFPETSNNKRNNNVLVELLLNLRLELRSQNKFNIADKIRLDLNNLGIIIKDKKDGYEWYYKNKIK